MAKMRKHSSRWCMGIKTFVLHFGTKRSIIVLKYRKGVNQINKKHENNNFSKFGPKLAQILARQTKN